MFCICSNDEMERIDERAVSEILLAAPGWARVGLAMPDERLRVCAADALAATINERLAKSPAPDRNQLNLPL